MITVDEIQGILTSSGLAVAGLEAGWHVAGLAPMTIAYMDCEGDYLSTATAEHFLKAAAAVLTDVGAADGTDIRLDLGEPQTDDRHNGERWVDADGEPIAHNDLRYVWRLTITLPADVEPPAPAPEAADVPGGVTRCDNCSDNHPEDLDVYHGAGVVCTAVLICHDCARPITYDGHDYHHAVRPEEGCFLIPAEAGDPARPPAGDFGHCSNCNAQIHSSLTVCTHCAPATYDPEGQTFDHARAMALVPAFEALGVSAGYQCSEAGTFPEFNVDGRRFCLGDVDETGVLGINTVDDGEDDVTGPFLSAWTPFASGFDLQYANVVAVGVLAIARRLVAEAPVPAGG